MSEDDSFYGLIFNTLREEETEEENKDESCPFTDSFQGPEGYQVIGPIVKMHPNLPPCRLEFSYKITFFMYGDWGGPCTWGRPNPRF
jgi:hypothetical protein